MARLIIKLSWSKSLEGQDLRQYDDVGTRTFRQSLQFSRESRDFKDAFPPHIDWDRPFGAQNESEYAK